MREPWRHRWAAFLVITVLLVALLLILLRLGHSLQESVTAAGVISMVAAEVAVRLLGGNSGGTGGLQLPRDPRWSLA